MTEYVLIRYDETEQKEIDRRNCPWTEKELTMMEVQDYINAGRGSGWEYLCCKAEDYESGKIQGGSPEDSSVFIVWGDFEQGNGEQNEEIIKEALQLWLKQKKCEEI